MLTASNYEALARLKYDESLTLHHDGWFGKYYVLTEYQLEVFNGKAGMFINGEAFLTPPYFVSAAWTKKEAWKKACYAED